MGTDPRKRRPAAIPVTALLVCCTVLGLAGTDLVLPAVPGLPAVLGGSLAQAQLVLATFAAGTGVGLLLFGELGARIDHRRLLAWAMLVYGLLSAAAAEASGLPLLIALRFLQGVAASCAAVVTPGMVRALFDEQGALRAIGVLGSVESLAPAVAPILGLWLLEAHGWQASFRVTAVLAVALALLVFAVSPALPERRGLASRRGYWRLLRRVPFQRHALSQGLALASLLTFVFAMPGVFVAALGGSLGDFITMQLVGIASFIVAANLSSYVVARIGGERCVWRGTLLALAGALGLGLYGACGGREAWVIQMLFVPLNMGFGFRGPPGFYAALQAAQGDDGRASALVILYTMLLTAGATGLIAPLLDTGLWAPGLAASILGGLSLLALHRLRARE